MTDEHHLSDENLLLCADGENAPAQSEKIRLHLAGCAECAGRFKALRGTLADFSRAHRESLDPELPPAATARASLKARLTQLALNSPQPASTTNPPRNYWLGWIRSAVIPGPRGYAIASLILAAVLLLAGYRREIKSGSQQISASLGLWSEPRTSLTPGATVPVTTAQLCSNSAERPVPAIPISLQRQVLAMYGVKGDPSNAYEVDYLITPELGGATDVRNLWPEPYYDTAWNAHVKDQLEELLRQKVCRGDVDLATAQQDISRDWIAAYQKYFHTDRPIAVKASVRQL
jgi:hypothetical protein